MAGKDAKVTVTLALLDQTQAALAQAQANFAKLKNVAGDSGGTLTAYRKGADEASEATNALTKSTEVLGGALKTVTSAIPGGRVATALIGAAGGTAFIGAATGLIVLAVKSAYDMEKAATSVATKLTIGGGSISQATSDLVSAAKAVSASTGFTNKQLIEGGGAYQRASGSSAIGQGDLSTLGTYARAFGLDITALGAVLGTFKQYNGGSASENASLLFGGAEDAGDFGRRDTYLPLIQQTIAAMQSGGNTFTGAEAVKLVNSVARGGGYFSSDQGAAQGVGALSGLGRASSREAYASALKQAAGVNPGDILTGDNPGRTENLVLKYLQQTMPMPTIDKATNSVSAGSMSTLLALKAVLGEDAGTTAFHLIAARGYNQLENQTIRGATDAGARAASALSTPSGKIDNAMRTFENALADAGDAVIPAFSSAMSAATSAILAASKGDTSALAKLISAGTGDPLSNVTRGLINSKDVGAGANVVFKAVMGAFNHGSPGLLDAATGKQISDAAKMFGVDPRLVYADYGKESSFGTNNPGGTAYSAMGLRYGPGRYRGYGYHDSGANTMQEALRTNAAMWADAYREMRKKGLPTSDINAVMAYEENGIYSPPSDGNANALSTAEQIYHSREAQQQFVPVPGGHLHVKTTVSFKPQPNPASRSRVQGGQRKPVPKPGMPMTPTVRNSDGTAVTPPHMSL